MTEEYIYIIVVHYIIDTYLPSSICLTLFVLIDMKYEFYRSENLVFVSGPDSLWGRIYFSVIIRHRD